MNTRQLLVVGAVTLATLVALRADDAVVMGPGLGVSLGPSLTGTGSAGAPIDVTGAASATVGQAATSDGAGGVTWVTPTFSGSAATISGSGSAGSPLSATPGNTTFKASATAGYFGTQAGTRNFTGGSVFAGYGVNGAGAYLTPVAGTNPYVGYTVYALDRDFEAENVTIGAGYVVDTRGYRLFVRGTLTLQGYIGARGTNGSGATAGAGSVAGFCGSGGNGGAGGVSANGAVSGNSAVAWPFIPSSTGATAAPQGSVGSPGTGVSQGGGGGGSAILGASGRTGGAVGYIDASGSGSTSFFAVLRCRTESNTQFSVGTGGSGGGGTSSPAGTGGGGGGAGGTAIVYARKIVTYSTGGILANGGNGGNAPSANCGGGGGGGGGVIVMFYNTRTHSGGGAPTYSVAGGTGGAGGAGGFAGGAGAAGLTYFVNMSGDGT